MKQKREIERDRESRHVVVEPFAGREHPGTETGTRDAGSRCPGAGIFARTRLLARRPCSGTGMKRVRLFFLAFCRKHGETPNARSL